MPTAPVNTEGAYVSYEDSGAPAGSSDYMTVVIIHGLVFHGGTHPDVLTVCELTTVVC